MMRSKSKVWDHFVRLSSLEAKCKYCQSVLKAGTSTSSLLKHIKAKHVHVSLEEEVVERYDSAFNLSVSSLNLMLTLCL